MFALIRERVWPRPAVRPVDVWVHGVSVGEVEVAATFASALTSRAGSLSYLLTSSTPAGTALLKRKHRGALEAGEIQFRPFPADLPFSVRRLLDSSRPRLLVLTETEIWPVLLRESHRSGIPVLIVNARLSEGSLRRLSKARWLFSSALKAISRIAARSEEDARRFEALGVDPARIGVSGDLKFDRSAPPEAAFASAFRELAGNRPVLVAGSIATEELDLVWQTQESLGSLLEGEKPLLLLAPRRPEAFDMAVRSAQERGYSVVRRSAIASWHPREKTGVFVLDSIGELASSYSLGTVALLGGTFAPKGGHNILEPLFFGLPVVHGPSISNIRRTVTDARGAVFEVPDAGAAAVTLAGLIQDDQRRKEAREIAASLFERNRGAAERAADMALALLELSA